MPWGKCPDCGTRISLSPKRRNAHSKAVCTIHLQEQKARRIMAKMRERGWQNCSSTANCLINTLVPLRLRPIYAAAGVRWGLWAPRWAVALARLNLSSRARKVVIEKVRRSKDLQCIVDAVSRMQSLAQWVESEFGYVPGLE